MTVIPTATIPPILAKNAKMDGAPELLRPVRISDALEVEPNLRRHRPWRHIVRSAERRQEVVQRVFVRDVHRRQPQTPLVAIAAQQVVLSQRCVEEIPWRNARRILVVVLRARRGNLDQLRGQFIRQAEIRQRCRRRPEARRSVHSPAESRWPWFGRRYTRSRKTSSREATPRSAA